MKVKRIKDGVYSAGEGVRIVRDIPLNIWTGRPMASREWRWKIYVCGVHVDTEITLREAKERIEQYGEYLAEKAKDISKKGGDKHRA